MNFEIYNGALVIFARAPRQGQVKSRLARVIGDVSATSLYHAMLRDTLALARVIEEQNGLLPIVAFTPQDAFDTEPSLSKFWTGARVLQAAGDLGHKMSAAGDWALARSAKEVLLIGTDAPDLPTHFIEQAVTSLQNFDAVTIPARDGGFVLWGARHAMHEVFAEIDWTQHHTLVPVLQNAARLNWKVQRLKTWSDVDEIDDVRALWARLQNRESVAPETARWLEQHRNLLTRRY